MKLATIRTDGGTAAVRIDADRAVEIGAPDVGAVLAMSDWQARAAAADGRGHAPDALDYAPLVLRPEKIVCVGLNFRDHILEMGRELPEFPTLFAKYASALIGAHDDIALSPHSQAIDWEGELAIVIGSDARDVTAEHAAQHIAGYSVINDVSARDWQYRTAQWLQGKTFEASTPLGPALVTLDELPDRDDLEVSTQVDGEVVQRASLADLVFTPTQLVSYISAFTTLRPGDVIAGGTPGGVGHAWTPPRYLTDGAVMTTRIAEVGECRNVCRLVR